MTDHLSTLDGRSLGRYSTLLRNIRPGRAAGERRFSILLRDESDLVLDPPAIEGLYFEGFGRWYRPWLEIRYQNELSGRDNGVDLTGTEEEEALFKMLCDVLPPGSHIMVPYRTHKITAMALMFRVPPAASPIGYLMYMGGCRWYKDWYFAEGFMEGEEKLQATKPLDDEKMQAKTQTIKDELRVYLSREPDADKPEIERVCRELANRILSEPDD